MIPHSAFPAELGLTETDAKLASLLIERERVSRAAAVAVLHNPVTDTPNPKNVKVYVHKLRKKLEPLEVEIITLWGWGWRISTEHREKLKSRLKITIPS